MITTKSNNKIIIEFEKTDTDLIKRLINAKIEELSCLVISMYNINFTKCEGDENGN